MGTSNSGSALPGTSVDYVAGQQWGSWIVAANNWLTDTANNGGFNYSTLVTIWGGDDVEPCFGPPAPARAFLDGYRTTTTNPIYNFGSCDGCVTTYTCPAAPCPNPPALGGWTLDDIWYVSWGAWRSYPMPEIYYPTAQAHQWKAISLYSIEAKGTAALQFDSPLSEYAACQQRTCAPGFLTPSAAWQELVNALAEDARTAWTPSFSSDIRWDPN